MVKYGAFSTQGQVTPKCIVRSGRFSSSLDNLCMCMSWLLASLIFQGKSKKHSLFLPKKHSSLYSIHMLNVNRKVKRVPQSQAAANHWYQEKEKRTEISVIIWFYYIQINEIQESIDEITCIFQKVLFSPMKNIKSVIQFWMTSAFSISFLCNSTVSLQIFKRLQLLCL